MRFLALLLLLCTTLACAEEPIARIGFGSCAKENKPQLFWDAIIAKKPELFLFIGDNIYADTEDMDVMREKYAKLAAIPGYQRMLKTCPLLATWDDHDYGLNDDGVEFPKKKESEKHFLDFYNVPADAPQRTREGIYHSQVFGPAGKRLQVILLDTRYFRTALTKLPREERKFGPYTGTKDPAATILGDAQWKWLAKELRKPAEIRIIASSIQFISEENGWETWRNFPKERQRMIDLIAETKAGGVFFISGDRHLAELSCDTTSPNVPYPLYDVTSSGLTNAGGGRPDEPNRHRIGKIFQKRNFGFLNIDWGTENPEVTLEVHEILDGGKSQMGFEKRVAIGER